MDLPLLQQRYVDFIHALFHEGVLDDQFTQLQQLQDPSNPGFVEEVVALFFDDSQKLVDELTKALERKPIDYKQVDAYVHQFKGSSSSIGAQRLKSVCVNFRVYCENKNLEGCWQCLQQVKHEFFIVKNRLEVLLQLEEQIVALGGEVPYVFEQ